MNKKYNQYDPGTYDPTKIILQAHPTTGQLSKILLSSLPGVNPIIKTFQQASTNPTAGYTNHYQYTIPANTMSQNGDTIEIEYFGVSTTSGVFKNVNAQGITTGWIWSGFTGSDNWTLKAKYIRYQNTEVINSSEFRAGNSISQIGVAYHSPVDWTMPIATHIQLYADTASVITVSFATIKFYKGTT